MDFCAVRYFSVEKYQSVGGIGGFKSLGQKWTVRGELC